MECYDPEQTIDPEEWIGLDEGTRQYLVELYHRKLRIKVPNWRAHAAIHVIVENQVALGSEIPVHKTLERLMRQGLSRHDAIHAIGSVLAGHIFDLIKNDAKGEGVDTDYYRQLEELTADGWLSSFTEESEEDQE